MKKIVSSLMLVMILMGTFALTFDIKPVNGRAGETIYIRADGSIDPSDAPITTQDKITYTLTDDITSSADGIVVERDNIVIDGAGYTLRGAGSYSGIKLIGRISVTIKNMNIQKFGCGIHAYLSSNITISWNNITANSWGGICFNDSSNNTISGNNITANNIFGIELVSNNTVSGNNIANNKYGIFVYRSNNTISGNNITNNFFGIWLDYTSSNNTISGNLFFNCGLVAHESYGNVVVDNLVNGKPLVYLEGVSNITVSEAGQVVLILCNRIKVKNLNLTNATVGVQLCVTYNTEITRNNIANNSYGIVLEHSFNNTFSGNNITANNCGIWLDHASSNNTISGNNITNNFFGIVLFRSSSHNSIVGNTFTLDGLLVVDSYHNFVEDNTVNGKPLIYLEGVANQSVGYAGQVILVKCVGIRVEGLNLSNTDIGVELFETNNTIISGNYIANNSCGISFYNALNNIVSGNYIANNSGGIWLDDTSSNNRFYHNNFVDNARQVGLQMRNTNFWDNGYPSGGNYWSDYTGVDIYSGPNQNEPGSDGIGDIPYVIDEDNVDRYPLMNPYPIVILDGEAPVIRNVHHKPLYPTSADEIFFYADVTDNVAVAKVQLNYTLDGGATWLLKDMFLLEKDTYSASLGPYPQGQIIGFYVVAYDTSGNVAFGSEIVLPIPGPPKVAPVVVSDEPPNPVPIGKDVGYNVTDTGIQVFANVSELGLYGPGLLYTISYSLDGGLTWIQAGMTYIGGFMWSYVIPAFTNILFKIEANDGRSSMVYWIIVGPWKYPVYLYFSADEKYFPVAGLDFDGDSVVENNWVSYETTPDYWKFVFRDNDIDKDGIRDVWSYAYMNPKSVDDGCLVIEYWIYYAFNEYAGLGPVLGDHEHDFECVYLWIDIATGKIKKVALSQHNWINHYTFLTQPKKINIAVEKGSHGMALLKDEDNDGLPEDLDGSPGYDIWQPEGGGTIIGGTWNDQSLVASLHPWVIYDPRTSPEELHLFGDPSILTTGFSLEAIHPLLPSVVDEIPQYYGWLTNMLGYKYVLKTSYGFPLPLTEDKMLVFQVPAPWYRQEFQNPSKMWNKASWIEYATKVSIKTILLFIKAGIFSYLKEATKMPWIEIGVAQILSGWIEGEIIKILFDPVRGSVIDKNGNVLGYKGDEITDEIPGSFIFLTRKMTNNMFDLYFIMTDSRDDYIYEVRGETSETYNVTISSTNMEGRETIFNAVNIPTKPNAIHRYIIHWNILERKEYGVEVLIDQNGDGHFETKFLSDDYLTADEFTFWEDVCHQIFIQSNSTISHLTFNQLLMQFSFNVTGASGKRGYCNVTIPKDLLKGPWSYSLKGDVLGVEITEDKNETHSFIHFTYTHVDTFQIVIEGTWVIPEYPPTTLLILLLLITILTAITNKKAIKTKNIQ